MKLILEEAIELDGSIEEELNESSGAKERNYYLSGIFSTPEVKNRNGRVYSRELWESCVAEYQKEISEKTINSLGELEHPPRSEVDPMQAVIRIIELKMKDGNVWGKAKILNNNEPETNKLKGLVKEGIKIGVSSRGIGSVSSTGVVESFKLICYDVVKTPSDYNANLSGVTESAGLMLENGILKDKEFKVLESGCIGECSLDSKLEESESGLKASNLEVFKQILESKGASIMCDLSISEKEEVLKEFINIITSTNEDTSLKDEELGVKLLEALSVVK